MLYSMFSGNNIIFAAWLSRFRVTFIIIIIITRESIGTDRFVRLIIETSLVALAVDVRRMHRSMAVPNSAIFTVPCLFYKYPTVNGIES